MTDRRSTLKKVGLSAAVAAVVMGGMALAGPQNATATDSFKLVAAPSISVNSDSKTYTLTADGQTIINIDATISDGDGLTNINNVLLCLMWKDTSDCTTLSPNNAVGVNYDVQKEITTVAAGAGATQKWWSDQGTTLEKGVAASDGKIYNAIVHFKLGISPVAQTGLWHIGAAVTDLDTPPNNTLSWNPSGWKPTFSPYYGINVPAGTTDPDYMMPGGGAWTPQTSQNFGDIKPGDVGSNNGTKTGTFIMNTNGYLEMKADTFGNATGHEVTNQNSGTMSSSVSGDKFLMACLGAATWVDSGATMIQSGPATPPWTKIGSARLGMSTTENGTTNPPLSCAIKVGDPGNGNGGSYTSLDPIAVILD